jgi:2-polyprenyl-6-methoxyphenol hydroxylase-like FAD-dependent oxidoreductase
MEKLEGVLIAGAGPVALVTALVLARSGVPVTLLESEPQIIPSPRAIVYHAPTVAVLDRLGVLSDALQVGMLKQDYQYRQADGRIVARMDMSVVAPDTAYPFNLHLGQDMLAEIILKHLLQTGRAQVRWSHRVVAVEPASHHVVVTADTPQGPRHFHAPWLVGADGARSGVRQALGLSFDGLTWPERFVAVNLQYDFEAHGYARANFVLDPIDWAIIPVLDQRNGWRVTYGEDASLPEEAVIDRAPQRLARLLPDNAPYRIDRIAPYRVHQRTAPHYRVGPVLLAGDAAHITNPCGGLGLTSGILDAVHLGDALAAVIQRRAPDHVLDDYAQERRDVFLKFTSPTASENKRRLSERDPSKRQADLERLRRLNDDPEFQREVLTATRHLQSKPYDFALD